MLKGKSEFRTTSTPTSSLQKKEIAIIREQIKRQRKENKKILSERGGKTPS